MNTLFAALGLLASGNQGPAQKMMVWVADQADPQTFEQVVGKRDLSDRRLAELGWVRVPGSKLDMVVSRDLWTPASYALLASLLRFLARIDNLDGTSIGEFPEECRKVMLSRANLTRGVFPEGNVPKLGLDTRVKIQFDVDVTLGYGTRRYPATVRTPLRSGRLGNKVELDLSIDRPNPDAASRLRTAYQIRTDVPLREYAYWQVMSQAQAILDQRRKTLEEEIRRATKAVFTRLFPNESDFESERLLGPLSRLPSRWRSSLGRAIPVSENPDFFPPDQYKVLAATGNIRLVFALSDRGGYAVSLRSLFDRP